MRSGALYLGNYFIGLELIKCWPNASPYISEQYSKQVRRSTNNGGPVDTTPDQVDDHLMAPSMRWQPGLSQVFLEAVLIATEDESP